MSDTTIPTYIVDGNHHIFTWPEGSGLLKLSAPELDAYRHLWVEAEAQEGGNILAHEGRMNVLNSRELELFAKAIAAVNGTVDWRPRLVFATEHVLETLRQQEPADEGDFLQRSVCRDEAFYGPLGTLARAVAPYTEADPVSILVQALVIAGATVGRDPWFRTGATAHHPHDFVVIVGATGTGRKGSGYDIARYAMKPSRATEAHGESREEEPWSFPQRVTGIGSGEGLIYTIHDDVFKKQPIRGPSPGKGRKGEIIGYEQVLADEGVADKRLIVEETEFSRVLKVASREGNTLSELLRQMWETGDLRNTVKGSPYRATGAHGVVIAHITPKELHTLLREVEMSNGFTNRFLWIYSHKTRDLPDGDELDQVDFAPVRKALKAAFTSLEAVKEEEKGDTDLSPRLRMRRTAAARRVWHAVYPLLNQHNPAVPGAVQGRAAAHVLRLSMIYALLDGTLRIAAPHVIAALAVWEYVEASGRYIFGEDTDDPKAQKLLDALRLAKDKGLSRKAIYIEVFHKHANRQAIDRMVRQLCDSGRAEVVKQRTSGRTRQVVCATNCALSALRAH